MANFLHSKCVCDVFPISFGSEHTRHPHFWMCRREHKRRELHISMEMKIKLCDVNVAKDDVMTTTEKSTMTTSKTRKCLWIANKTILARNKCGFCFHRAKSDCFPHDIRIRVFLIRHNACKRSQLVTIKSNFSAKNKFQLIKIGAAAAVEIVAALLYSLVGLLSRFLFILCRLFIL